MGVLMPLIEEMLKPLALWTLRKRLLTPAEGFSAGLLAGAGFALFESATIIAQTGVGADWSQMVMLRIATSLLHMTTSGFVGWGLASGWTRKKYGRTILTILAATGIHGLWNSLVISMALIPVMGNLVGQSPILHFFSGMGAYYIRHHPDLPGGCSDTDEPPPATGNKECDYRIRVVDLGLIKLSILEKCKLHHS